MPNLSISEKEQLIQYLIKLNNQYITRSFLNWSILDIAYHILIELKFSLYEVCNVVLPVKEGSTFEIRFSQYINNVYIPLDIFILNDENIKNRFKELGAKRKKEFNLDQNPIFA